MERTDYTKVFDVSRPSQTGPDPTSKPVIVGHHPMMADPMVRPKPVHTDPEAGFDSMPHHAKVIEVTDEARASIAHSQPPSSEQLAAAAAAEEQRSGHMPSTAAPAAEATLVDQAAAAPQPVPVLPIQQAAPPPPPPPQDLSQIQHVPVSHMPVSQTGRFRSMMLWLFIGLILVGFGLYLAIDAGFISTGINLPFHIFSREG